MKDNLEYYDIVNDKDEVVGKVSENERNTIKANQFRVINIIIENEEGKILVPKRSSNRRIFPNCYDFSVGGFVSSGETYEQAAYRELEEELGIKNVTLKKIAYLNPYYSDSNTFQTVYSLKYDKEVLDYDKNGIEKIFYMTKEEIKDLMNKSPELFKSDYFCVMNFLFNC